MSPLTNIRKSAICLTGSRAYAYRIVQLAEKLPESVRRHVVPVTAARIIAETDMHARVVIRMNEAAKAARVAWV